MSFPFAGFSELVVAPDVACNKESLLISEEIIYFLNNIHICCIKLPGKHIVMLYHKEKATYIHVTTLIAGLDVQVSAQQVIYWLSLLYVRFTIKKLPALLWLRSLYNPQSIT